MIWSIIEILLPIFACFLVIKFRFRNKFQINDTSFLFEILIAFTGTGAILGLYLNQLVFDIIDHQFNSISIIIGLISSVLLILAYRTNSKTFLLIDLTLWLFVLAVKGGYQCGFGIGLPYLPILFFDIISILLRLQLLRKLVINFSPIILFAVTIVLVIIKFLFLGFPIAEKLFY